MELSSQQLGSAPRGAPLSAGEVVQTLKLLTQTDESVRKPAERVAELWRRTSAPGYLPALLETVAMRNQPGVDANVRLLAAIMAKNVVGSAWDRIVNPHAKNFQEQTEWSHVPEVDKERLKVQALPLLFSETLAPIRTQLILLVASIARHEFPTKWPTLIRQLLEVPDSFDSEIVFTSRLLALKTLKHVLVALKGRKKYLTLTNVKVLSDRSQMEALTKRVLQEQRTLYNGISASFPPLLQSWRRNSSLFGSGAHGWEAAGRLANQSLTCMRQALYAVDSVDEIRASFHDFLAEASNQASALKNLEAQPPAGSLAHGDLGRWREVGSKSFVVINQCCVAAVEKHAIAFGEVMPTFMNIYLESMLGLDYKWLQEVSQKRLVLMTRFLAKVLHSPMYNPRRGYQHADLSFENTEDATLQVQQQADKYIKGVFESQAFTGLIESLISKYLVLTDGDLGEWEHNPEGYFLLSDLEQNIDSESRIPCGETLLIFLIERDANRTAQVLLNLATQVQQHSDPQSLRLREATYHAINTVAPVIPSDMLNFESWFASELVQYLEGRGGALIERAMQVRVLHLVQTFKSTMGPESLSRALAHAIAFLGSPDLVVALSSVKLIHAMCLTEIVSQHREREGDAGSLSGLKENAAPIITACFLLASRLSEPDNLHLVLRLISAEIEAVADGDTPELIQCIASYIPPLWQRISQGAQREQVGAEARLQSSLVALLIHVVEKVGEDAIAIQSVREVVFQLIAFSMDLAAPHSVYLLEDGMKLWHTVLIYGSLQSIGDFAQRTVKDFFVVLASRRDLQASLSVLLAFLVLCGQSVLYSSEGEIKAVIEHGLGDKGTMKDAMACLQFLYVLTLADPRFSFHVCGDAIKRLIAKLGGNQLPGNLFVPLMSLLTLLVLWKEDLLTTLITFDVDTLMRTLLSFHGVKSVPEFLALKGARAHGSMKRKMAVTLLCSIARQNPQAAKTYGMPILRFLDSETQHAHAQTIDDVMDIRACLPREAGSEIWRKSAFYARLKQIVEQDPMWKLDLMSLRGALASEANVIDGGGKEFASSFSGLSM